MAFYITTPIYYVNAKPHLGHAYTTIVCDTLTRFHRLLGEDTYFLTGTDEHGDKIAEASKKEGCPPQDYVDYVSALFKITWPKFDIKFSDFIRTTEPRHKEVVSRFLEKVNDKGDIYFGEYGGLYCVGCERFYTEKELVDGLCPDHKVAPKFIEEKNYFFRMSNYQDWLIDYIKQNPDLIRPERFRKEVLSFLSEPLEDLCISRPKTRLTWGIDIPFDKNYVTYVWFDALINYITALGWPDGEKYAHYWPYAEHCVAKDILKPHAIFWPTMLQSAGLPIYKHLNVHGYWQMDKDKMSKSVGNVVDIFTLREEFGVSAVRYFLMREMNFGLDSEFSYKRVLERYNSDLANDLGNLWQRSITMLKKYSGGIVSSSALSSLAQDSDWENTLKLLVKDYTIHFSHMRPSEALKRVWEFVSSLNKRIDVDAPWELAKSEDNRQKLDLVLASLVKGLALIGALIWPVMPITGEEFWRRLGLAPESITLDSAAITLALGHGKVIEPGEAFFKRAEKEPEPGAKEKQVSSKDSKEKAPEGRPEVITYDDFAKLDLQTGLILEAEAVKKSEKLVKLTIKLSDTLRTIVAGIRKSYTPEELVGQSVVIVANLAPRELMGIKSHGMLLCASGPDTLSLLTPSREVPPGSQVS
ncbi:MAG: methionine--tRNA ligase [Deltaproteobacteria bacterium]|jgi:methionyl-tRNA synthetase|nr:methionine--tRNA ligase [Deltaproteobacteria bacterium]